MSAKRQQITTQDNAEQIRLTLEDLYNSLSNNREAQRQIALVWERVAALGAANEHNEALVASLTAAIEEVRAQRDYALYDRDVYRLRGELMGETAAIEALSAGLGINMDEFLILYDWVTGELPAEVGSNDEIAGDAIRDLIESIKNDRGLEDL